MSDEDRKFMGEVSVSRFRLLALYIAMAALFVRMADEEGETMATAQSVALFGFDMMVACWALSLAVATLIGGVRCIFKRDVVHRG